MAPTLPEERVKMAMVPGPLSAMPAASRCHLAESS